MNRHEFGHKLIDLTSWLANQSTKGAVNKTIFSLYRFLLSICGFKILPIITIESFSKTNGGEMNLLFRDREGISVNSTSPFVEEQKPVYNRLDDIYSTCCKNVFICGHSDILVDAKKKVIINDFSYNQSANVFSSDTLLLRNKNNWGILNHRINQKAQIIESGIMVSGKTPKNYYHAMFENLNRCILIDDSIIPKDVPILVDKSAVSITSLCSLITMMTLGTKRKVITVEQGKLYLCKKLYYLDHINYIISQRRAFDETLIKERNFYDPNLLKKQRDTLLCQKANIRTPECVFLTRSNTRFRHFNEDEIFEVLKKYGFEKVAPEQYTLEEQMAIFNNARFIIGGSGAAFSNVIFCQNTCKILCFRALKGDVGSSVFKTIAWINGISFWHYPADEILNNHGIHADYYISPSKLESILINDWHLSMN